MVGATPPIKLLNACVTVEAAAAEEASLFPWLRVEAMAVWMMRSMAVPDAEQLAMDVVTVCKMMWV